MRLLTQPIGSFGSCRKLLGVTKGGPVWLTMLLIDQDRSSRATVRDVNTMPLYWQPLKKMCIKTAWFLQGNLQKCLILFYGKYWLFSLPKQTIKNKRQITHLMKLDSKPHWLSPWLVLLTWRDPTFVGGRNLGSFILLANPKALKHDTWRVVALSEQIRLVGRGQQPPSYEYEQWLTRVPAKSLIISATKPP